MLRLSTFLKPIKSGGDLLLLSVLAFSFGCGKKQPIVVVDDWWNVDFAKNDCEMRARNGDAQCIGDPVAEVREFEALLRTSFASDASCSGVLLADFAGPKQGASNAASEADASKADWWLMLDFDVGESSQSWTMVHHAQTTTGHGNPKELVHTLCAVVKQVGGSISN